MEIKIARKLLIIATTLLLALCTHLIPVAAEPSDMVPDLPDGPYDLKVVVRSVNPDGTKTGIGSATISIYKVATLRVENTAAFYSEEEDFSDGGIDFDGMSASQSNYAARKYTQIVRDEDLSGKGQKTNTNSSGEAIYKDLSPGIYLVMLDGYDYSNAGYTLMEPFLVRVPDIDSSSEANKWIVNVIATPKADINPRDHIEVDPPVIKKVKGKDKCGDEFTFELRADDIINPMPFGSIDGKKQTTMIGAGETEFGPWTFTEPGNYGYTVYEVEGADRNCKYDSTVYHLNYRVYYAGSRLRFDETLIDNDGNVRDGPAAFEFLNEFKKSAIPSLPITGDDTRLLLWAMLTLLSAITVIVVFIHRKQD